MKHGVRSLLIALVAITALVGCNRRGESQTDAGVAPSPTPGVTPTTMPTPTLLPSPTSTPTPTPMPPPTPGPEVEVSLGEALAVEHGGFSYRHVVGYRETYRPGIVTISSDDEEVLLAIGGGLSPEEATIQEGLEGLLMNVAADIEDFTADEPFTMTIDGIEALAVDVRGYLYEDDIRGRIAYVIPNDLQFFLAFGNAPEGRWEAEGMAVFQTLLGSVSFFKPTPMENLCPVTADPSYGYSRDNPIRVGEGDLLAGPSLEQAYLDQLRGPEGQIIEYERLGSENYGATMLDAYQVIYNGTSVVLYLDMYHLEPFRVPIGFTCAWKP